MKKISSTFCGGNHEDIAIEIWESASHLAGGMYSMHDHAAHCSEFKRQPDRSGQPLNVREGGREKWIKGYFNTDAFTPRKDGEFGNSGVNLMFGPPHFNVDSALMKNWDLTERVRAQFRFEMFNAFNHPIMGLPNTNPSSATFGMINGGHGSAANASRVGQVALKLSF